MKREPSEDGTDGSDHWLETPPDHRQSRNQKGVRSSLHGEEKAKKEKMLLLRQRRLGGSSDDAPRLEPPMLVSTDAT